MQTTKIKLKSTMRSFTKIIIAVVVLFVLPLKQFGQRIQTTNNQPIIEFNITDIAGFDQRVIFLHDLISDCRFDVITSERDGVFLISANEAFDGINLQEAFNDFREQSTQQYNLLSKEECAQTALEYKAMLPNDFILSLMMDTYVRSRLNNTCANADPFCTDNGLYEFPAGVNAGSGESGPDYNCLYSTPNPAWYYMRILNPGNIDIYMYSTPSHDIDFCCWGPFTDPITPCPNGLTSDKVVSCSYSAAATEHCLIPSTAQTGDYFILVITNYSNATCNISFSKVSGTGTTDCGILPPLVDNNGPYCVGETITLTANGQAGATYSWSGPGGFSSAQQNPTRPNCTLNMAGTYTCTISVGNQTNSATTEVVIYPDPTANFNFTSVCQGTPTQFNSTATTNPNGQQIQSYQWNFGDGQTGSGQSVMHTYAQPGNYQVTHTVSTGNGHCTDQKTQTVPVYAAPSASATAQPSTVMYGQVATLTASAGTTGTFNFHWEPSNMVVNPNSQTTQTVQLQATQTFTVTVTNPQGGCSSTAQVTVSMNGSNMTATATADHYELCEGESTTLHAIPAGGTGSFTYNWTPANTLNNASNQNPIATPPVGTTTYTCTVSDGITSQNVTVTITVHPNRESNIYENICENETYNFFGNVLQTPGVYDHTIQTVFGCDSLIHLHLGNWQIYETPVTDHFCQGEQYMFFGEALNTPGLYYHTLQSEHGCDSTIRLNLIEDPIYEVPLMESTCEGGPGYYYQGDYLQPSSSPYIYVFESASGCDSIISLYVSESEYNSKTYSVSICAEQYTWPSNNTTYYSSGVYYDTLSYPNSCDSTLVLFLELRPSFSTPLEISSCDVFRWRDEDFQVDTTFYASTTYTHHYINSYGCNSDVTLYLTVKEHDETEETHPEYTSIIGCDSAYWNPRGYDFYSEDLYQPENNWYTISSQTNRPYQRVYTNHVGCDSIVRMPLHLEYTPQPVEIRPVDLNNSAPHWVVTATEFQVNCYDFNIWEEGHPSSCHWDSIRWEFEDPSMLWMLEPDETTVPAGKRCRMYVLNHVDDTIWLRATVYNMCAPQGVSQRYWFVCSWYDVEEQSGNAADFSVVPNPNNGMMTLTFENLTGKIDVKVYDMTGCLIDHVTTYSEGGTETMHYDMHHRSEGIYFIVATSKEGSAAKKVVIRR